jgi:hypothetical protein
MADATRSCWRSTLISWSLYSIMASGICLASWLLTASALRAELVPDTSTVDFGQVSSLDTPQREVVLHSVGPVEAELLQAQASCGCVQVEILSGRATSDRPARLRLTLHPLRAPPGRNVWEICLRYRVGETMRETRLAAVATVVREITVHPPQLELSLSSASECDLLITDHRAKPLRILGCETNAPQLRARVIEEPRGSGPPYQWRIRLQVSPEIEGSVLDGQVVLLTDDARCPRITVPVRVRRLLASRILVSPPESNFVLTGNTPVSRLFTFRDRNGQACRIAHAEAPHPALNCRWAEGTFPITTLQVTVDPNHLPPGETNLEIKVLFAEPGQTVVSIPIRLQRR